MSPDAGRPGVVGTPGRQDVRGGGGNVDDHDNPDRFTVRCGALLRLVADPELYAIDLVDRAGPVLASAIAVAVLDLVAGVTR